MSHLDYYRQHGIAPVRYDLSDLDAHFQRRAALYRGLGLLPLAVRGAHVLEVAAGTGQNSLYLASLMPASLTLIEPNPTGARGIEAAYAGLSRDHTRPTLIECTLEHYSPARTFDVVICENWLGSSAHERALLAKLATMVAPSGVLVITFIAPEGMLPNIFRRALSACVARPDLPFERRTAILVEAFAPHLATIRGMTRSPEDWVHDNMMNPAYFDLCLTLRMALDEVGREFQAVGTSPLFRRDWRWFKALHGGRFEFNQTLLDECDRLAPCFLDYRVEQPGEGSTAAGWLQGEALGLLEDVRAFERETVAGRSTAGEARGKMRARARRIADGLKELAPDLAIAAAEACELLARDSLAAADIAAARPFAAWFGRETLYLSLERVGQPGLGS